MNFSPLFHRLLYAYIVPQWLNDIGALKYYSFSEHAHRSSYELTGSYTVLTCTVYAGCRASTCECFLMERTVCTNTLYICSSHSQPHTELGRARGDDIVPISQAACTPFFAIFVSICAVQRYENCDWIKIMRMGISCERQSMASLCKIAYRAVLQQPPVHTSHISSDRDA